MKRARILDGRAAADRLLTRLRKKIKKHRPPITLATILVGRRLDSVLYVQQKMLAAKKVGIRVRAFRLPVSTSQKTLNQLLQRLERNRNIHGILLQLPLPGALNADQAINSIPPSKDVDGFHRQSKVAPPTIAAVLHLLRLARSQAGAAAIILARDTVFSKKLTLRLLRRDIHAKLLKLKGVIPTETKRADIIITALGRGPRLTAANIKSGAVVIDVGIRRRNGKVTGDVDPSVWRKAKAVSPVPGGVGPLTVAYVLYNTYRLAKRKL